MNGRERIQAMIRGEAVDHLPLMPITMMFAADMIGEKYGKYATDYRVLAEGQVRTAEAFGFDYVSAISDPACEAADCGADVTFFDDQPPAIKETNALLAETTRLASLEMPAPDGGGRMTNRLRAIEELRRRVGDELLVEGWIEGPCAEASDLRGINHLMLDFHTDPPFVNDLFDFCVEMELAFAKAQIEAGADLIGLGDAAASLVGPQVYDEFVFEKEKRLVEGIQAAGGAVRLHICGDTRAILGGMGRLGCEIVDLDFLAPVAMGREAMGPDQVLLGNIDPVRCLRDGSPDSVKAALAECHRAAGARYIVGAGCEVTRDTAHANVHAMREYARSHGA